MSAASSGNVPPITFSQRRNWTEGSPISFLMKQGVENPQVISLAAGLVDEASLPVEEAAAAARSVLSTAQSGRQALQYGTTGGLSALRDEVLQHFARLEGKTVQSMGLDIDQVMLTTGSQQFLSLVCEVLLNPGDICLVAGPTYFVFLANLQGVGAQAITVATDEQGMRTDALDRQLQELEAAGQLGRVKLIYLVSYYENPSGVSLSEQRRREVVEIARKWSRDQRILILEDAAYRELRYDGPVFSSIFSFDSSRDHVLYTQTFSKTFSPGVRVGFGIAPREMLSALADRKGNEDFGSANFNQHVLYHVLRTGSYGRHVEHVRAAYRLKRDAMQQAAERYFSSIPGVSWLPSQGGLYLWMSLPTTMETGFESRLFRTAVDEGVMYVPGEHCYGGAVSSRPRHQMRLSFGVQQPEGIDAGMQRLARAVRKILSE